VRKANFNPGDEKMAITKKSLISSKPATKSTKKQSSIPSPAAASKLVGASHSKAVVGANGRTAVLGSNGRTAVLGANGRSTLLGSNGRASSLIGAVKIL
jgi:hypothetical protein